MRSAWYVSTTGSQYRRPSLRAWRRTSNSWNRNYNDQLYYLNPLLGRNSQNWPAKHGSFDKEILVFSQNFTKTHHTHAYHLEINWSTIRDKSSWHTCLTRVLLTITHICYLILFKRRKYPTPKSMLFVVKERLEGLKHNISFEGRGCWYTGGGDRIVHYSKRGHFIELFQHFCSSL